MCQRNDSDMYTYFKSHQLTEFYKLVLDPNVEVITINPLSDSCVCVTHRVFGGSGTPCKTQSVVIGVFVTAYARRKLYTLMNLLGDQMVYCDTGKRFILSTLFSVHANSLTNLSDSAVYVKDPCGYSPPLSSYLGGWESELQPDEYIDSWVVSV